MSTPRTAHAPARVVFVEDDASIQRFVAMALEDLPLSLQTCTTLAEARHVLAQAGAPCDLLLTDLMLPDGSGLDLLEELHDAPAARRPRRIAVFSAGVTGAVRSRLEALGIDTVLPKPVSLAALDACVRAAIDPAPDAAAAASDGPGAPDPTEAEVVATYFAGDAGLFQSYRASCLSQFTADLAMGDAAVRAHDDPALRRLAHSLKSVLRMLGHPALAACAAELEDLAAAGSPDAAGRWPALREGVHRLASPAPARTPA